MFVTYESYSIKTIGDLSPRNSPLEIQLLPSNHLSLSKRTITHYM
jgi:hypothetical protein